MSRVKEDKATSGRPSLPPSEVIREAAKKKFEADRVRELRPGEDVPVYYTVEALVDYLDKLDK